jgi:hypothetical protein
LSIGTDRFDEGVRARHRAAPRDQQEDIMLGLTFTPVRLAGSAPEDRPGPTHEECAESQALAGRLMRAASTSLRRAPR